MKSKKSAKCLSLFQAFVLLVFVVSSLQSCMNTKDTLGSVRSAAGAKIGTTLTIRNGKAATGYVYFELDTVANMDTRVTFAIDPEALEAQLRSDYVAVSVPAGGNGNAVAITAVADQGGSVSSKNEAFIYQVAVLDAPVYDKAIKNLCYIEVNNDNPLNAGEYTLSDGKPFFDIVSVFAANINLNAEGMPYIHCNDQVTFVLEHADEIIRPLQEKGIKVHLSILGNHDDAGMRSLSAEGAEAFAKELKMYADIYGFDGFDFDDEYSSYAENNFKGSAQSGRGVVASLAECTSANYTKLMEACRKLLPKGESTFGIYWYIDDDQPVWSVWRL